MESAVLTEAYADKFFRLTTDLCYQNTDVSHKLFSLSGSVLRRLVF